MEFPSFLTPEIFRIGPFALRWYAMMYVLGYIIGFQLFKKRIKMGVLTLSETAGENFVSYFIFGMLIGARLFYVVFYNLDYYLEHPIESFYVWQGGLSFHGAAVGMVVACALLARKYKIPFYMATDTLAMTCGIGLFLGRIGNFINAELYGRPTDSVFGMIFPTDPDKIPRHPSQLYQGLTEGLLLTAFLWWLQSYLLKKNKFRHGITGVSFLIGYGVLRFFMEFTREPDSQLGLLFFDLSMGQLLCIVMASVGAVLMVHVHKTMPIFIPKTLKK